MTEYYNQSMRGDYTAQGVGLRNLGGDTINLTGLIPAGSTIKKAVLYWSTPRFGGAPNGQGKFNGNLITGTLIGTVSSFTYFDAYLYDVTSIVNDNINTLSEFPSGSPNTDGASLVVVYENTSLSYKTITINHDFQKIDQPDSQASITFNNFLANKFPISAKTTYIVGNGEPIYPDEAIFNNITVSTADAFNGADGQYWDTRTDDVSSKVSFGAISSTATVKSLSGGAILNDSLFYLAQVFAVEVLDPTRGLTFRE